MARFDAPDYLPGSLRERFFAMAEQLTCRGGDQEIIAATLAQYLIAEMQYLRATNHLTSALACGDANEAAKWGAQQERSFRQSRAAADVLERYRDEDAQREIYKKCLQQMT